MIYQITHTSTYDYRDPVSVSHHILRLSPRPLSHQRCLRHEVVTYPIPTITAAHTDYFGNAVTFVTIEGAHRQLVVTSSSSVSVLERRVPPPSETPAWETVREFCRGRQIGPALDASEFIFDSPLIRTGEGFADYAAPSFTRNRPILDAVLDLTRRIHDDFKFDATATTLSTPLDTVFRERRGVCQDFAHLQIACLRSLGLPARYVSGYLETDPPPGSPRLEGADASHAWVAFYGHGIGWIDVDPTNNLIPTTRHITAAWGRDYGDVSPVRGVILGSGDHEVKVAVDVVPTESEET
jgi:transglutaminase-like putative cysteine protease